MGQVVLVFGAIITAVAITLTALFLLDKILERYFPTK